jgi:FlaA1/EpsC-like NDP-sugar epimerase
MQTRIPRAINTLPRSGKKLLMAAWDAAVAPLCLLGAVSLRWESVDPSVVLHLWPMVFVALATPPIFWFFGLYREITRYIGPRYAWLLAQGSTVTVLLLATALLLTDARGKGIPRTALPIFGMMLFCATGGVRLVVRHLLRGQSRRGRPVAIYGAGDAGAGLAAVLGQDRATRVVAFFDDNPSLAGGSVRGVKIHSTQALEKVLAEQRVDALLVALSPQARKRQRAVLERAAAAGVRVLSVPTLGEIGDGRVRVDQLRPIAIEELLGRPPVEPDPRLLSANISGKTVLITGAGGSIGSELCRQVLKLHPKSLILLDSCEFNLFQIDDEISRAARAAAPGSARVSVHRYLASVTDAVRVDRIVSEHRPDTIYHAAAYKHVPIVEDNESEGAEVNVLGTLRVAEAAVKHGVSNFVFVSTDKAVRPTSIMGATKRMAEMVLQALQERFGGERGLRFVMVRFGNVLGSSGSVVPIFQRQIAAGGPVTVTHPDVTRYFMTIPEAVQLILQAGAMGEGGDVFVLDMGEPVRIADLARNMIQLGGRTVRSEANPAGEIEIVYTGLRPGEKMFEELVIGSDVVPTAHRAILRAREGHEPWERMEGQLQALEARVSQHDDPGVRQLLRDCVAGYRVSAPEP